MAIVNYVYQIPPHLINLEWNLPTVFMTVVPHQESSTSESRKQLPQSVSVDTETTNLSVASLLYLQKII